MWSSLTPALPLCHCAVSNFRCVRTNSPPKGDMSTYTHTHRVRERALATQSWQSTWSRAVSVQVLCPHVLVNAPDSRRRLRCQLEERGQLFADSPDQSSILSRDRSRANRTHVSVMDRRLCRLHENMAGLWCES